MGQLFKYPFIPEVWGTVSDWTMVIVTFVTAILLYKTLRAQNELAKRDYLRHVREILPIISFEIQRITSKSGQIKFIIKNNPAFDLVVKNISDEGIQFTTFKQSQTLSAESFNQDLPMIIDFTFEDGSKMNSLRFAYDITFKDAIGTSYHQEVMGFIHTGFGHQIAKKINS